MAISFGTHRATQIQQAPGFGFFWSGVRPSNTAAPPQIVDDVLLRQEQPWHPGSFVRPGIQGPNVRVPVRDTILVRQEQPYHPGSFFWTGPKEASPRVGETILLRQEYPWHPSTYTLSFPPPTPEVPAFRRALITTQEMPWHPRPYLYAGTHPLEYEDRQFFFIL